MTHTKSLWIISYSVRPTNAKRTDNPEYWHDQRWQSTFTFIHGLLYISINGQRKIVYVLKLTWTFINGSIKGTLAQKWKMDKHWPNIVNEVNNTPYTDVLANLREITGTMFLNQTFFCILEDVNICNILLKTIVTKTKILSEK